MTRNAALYKLLHRNDSIKQWAKPYIENKDKILSEVKSWGLPAGAAESMKVRLNFLAKPHVEYWNDLANMRND